MFNEHQVRMAVYEIYTVRMAVYEIYTVRMAVYGLELLFLVSCL